MQELGGWTNPGLADYFGDYARLCYQLFGEYVKYWVTINEPQSFCYFGYAGEKSLWKFPPDYDLVEEGLYLCAYTNAKAHALAYHIYQDEFKAQQQGTMCVTIKRKLLTE